MSPAAARPIRKDGGVSGRNNARQPSPCQPSNVGPGFAAYQNAASDSPNAESQRLCLDPRHPPPPPSPARGEGGRFEPSPLAGEGWVGGRMPPSRAGGFVVLAP